MKIGFDAKRIFNNATGLGNYSRSLVSNLQHFFPEQEYHLFSPEARHSDYAATFLHSGHFHIHQSKTRLKSYWRSFSIVKDLALTGIELYHGLSNELPHNLHREGIKSVVTIHDLIFKLYPGTYTLSERLIYDRKFRYACQHADRIVAISENTKQDIIRLYGTDPAKIEVVYQTCNPLFYRLRPADENEEVLRLLNLPSRFFLYVGSVEERKNLKLIVAAMHQLPQRERLPLVIVGRGGAYKKACKQLIASLGLEQYFIWLEVQDNLQLQSLYQSAAALIYPSFYEGFGLPVAEALLSKTPVITAATSSLKEAGGPDSFYIDPADAATLAEAMLRIIQQDPSLPERCAKGYAYAQQTFSPGTLTAQLMQLYQTLT
ncbi:MAG: glycosyltransferase family 4 protein [Chitinophagaceae bacterium]|nr:glycosyltransferase family 4 protein [Chitinophagaceae bacterium]